MLLQRTNIRSKNLPRYYDLDALVYCSRNARWLMISGAADRSSSGPPLLVKSYYRKNELISSHLMLRHLC